MYLWLRDLRLFEVLAVAASLDYSMSQCICLGSDLRENESVYGRHLMNFSGLGGVRSQEKMIEYGTLFRRAKK